MQVKRATSIVIQWILVVAVCAAAVFPVYWMAVCSINPRERIYAHPPALIPSSPRIENYVDVISNYSIVRWILNTLIVAGATSVVSISLSTVAAYALSRFRFRGRSTTQILILVTQMIPGTLLIIPIYLIFKRVELLNSFVGLVITFTTFSLPFCIWMLRGFLNTIPSEVDQAAQIDGCTQLQALLHVIIPLSGPGIATAGIFSFIMGWDEFLMARVMITDQSKWVVSLGISSFIGEYNTYFDQISAASLLVSIPVIVLFIFLQKLIISGLTQGSIKA